MKPTFFSRFTPAILLVTVFFCPLIFMGAARALKSNKNDVAQWLPPVYEETKRFNEFKARFGGEEFVLVSWDGCTLSDDRLTLFDAKLEPGAQKAGEPALFEKVLTGPEAIQQMMDVNVPREDAIERLKGSLIGPDGQTTCAVLTLSPAGKENLKQAIGKIEKTAIEECNIPEAALHMGGPPVDNVAIDRAGEQSLFRLAGFAAGIGLIISWWCLRSMKLVALVFSAGILSSASSLAIVYYTGSAMNAILLTMPSLVYVAAISGSIHLTNYYRDTVIEEGLHGATGRAVKHAALPIFLATVTTAFGLASLAYSELTPIQLFGIYSGVGVVISALFMMLYLPATLEYWPDAHLVSETHKATPTAAILPDPFMSPRWAIVGEWIIRRWGVVLVGCIAFMAVCAYGLNYAQTSIQMMKLFNKDAHIIQDYRWLEEHLGELIPMEIVVTVPKDSEKISFLERVRLMNEIQETVNEIPNVGSSLSAATFMPDPNKRSRGRIFGVKDKKKFEENIRNKRLLEHRDEILKGDYLRETADGQEIWRVSARVAALKDVDYGEFVFKIKEAVDPIIADYHADGIDDLKVEYTGLVPLIYKAQRSLLDGLISGFAMDLALITLVMMLAVRSVTAGLLLILPSLFPAVVIFGLMSWFRIPIDIGTVMTPAVALGVTVDDVVHFMLKYRGGVEKGQSRGDAIMTAYRGCARPMYQSWGVIGLGLSVFALSPFTPTQRFGYLIVTLLSAALPGNLLLLPALLLSPLGIFFGRPPRKKRKAKHVATEGSSDATHARSAHERLQAPPVVSHAARSGD